ncbi:hypothetical protein L195_g061881, partial [Trifolium pratense]
RDGGDFFELVIMWKTRRSANCTSHVRFGEEKKYLQEMKSLL